MREGFFQEIFDYIVFFVKYLGLKIKNFGLFLEDIKSFIIAILIAKRGKYSLSFLNSIFFLTAIVIYSFSPVIAENNPFVKKEEFIPGDLLSLEYNPQQNSIITEISVKPRDKIVKYKVKKGETLSSIAKKFNIDVQSIKWANDLKSDVVREGEVLDIPPIVGVVHKVKKGETIYTIAKKYKVDAQNIVNFPFNEFEDEETFALKPGQILYVPGGVIEDKPKVSVFAQRGKAPTGPGTVQAGVAGSGNFIWPASGRITQYPVVYHMALDIANRSAPDIIASDQGTVVYSGCLRYGYGCHVIIDHGNGYRTLYAHMARLYVKVGDQVSKGQALGKMGSTGRSTGTHVHFEIIFQGRRLNPLSFLR